MINLLRIAIRDLGRNRRRSFFSALALAIGLALLFFIATVIAGEMNGAIDKAIKLQSGHLQVRAGSYDETKTSLAWKDLIENPEAVAGQVASLPVVKVATPRLYATGIIAQANQTVGVRIVGIDPPSEANAPFRDSLVSGAYLTSEDSQGILIGQTLADKLGVKSGDTISLLANTSNGDVSQQPFSVRGIFTTHTPGFDGTTLFMPLAKAQALTQTQNHASLIFVLLNDTTQTGAVVNALQTSQYQVKTYEQLNEIIVSTEQLANSYIFLVYLIVLGITATVIINTLIMAVFERTREIGILAAIGMKGSRIMAMFLAETTLLAIGGILMGLVLGGLFVIYDINFGIAIPNFNVTGILLGDKLYGQFVPGDYLTLTIMAFVITLLAGLYPALLASRMEPVEALRGGK